MKTNHSIVCTALAALVAGSAAAKNPVVETWFTPDPAPYVHGDTVYLFADHDEDDAHGFTMKDWILYSTKDMVNWTWRGAQFDTHLFKWAVQGNDAWASQAVERNGKWYWYVAVKDAAKNVHGVGVATAPSPTGPWTDQIGKPLVPGDWGFIDPSVFIDTDGRAYLFWGNNGCWYGELNEDMVSFKNGPKGWQEVPGLKDPKAFGPLVMKHDWAQNKKIPKTNFEEAPWVYKRGNTYYLEYAAGGVPENWSYSTASNINGPWTYRGRILDESPRSFTIHGGSITFKGRSFLFYHDGRAANGGGFRRSTSIEEFRYNPDGSIPKLAFTEGGVGIPVATLDPFARVEAETMAEGYGVKVDRQAGAEHWLRKLDNGDWTLLRDVKFGDRELKGVTARVRSDKAGGRIELNLDICDGETFAVIEVPDTKGQWQTVAGKIVKQVKGVRNVGITFRGGDDDLFEFDCWQLK